MRIYKILSQIFMALSFEAFFMGAIFVLFGMIFGGNETAALMTVCEAGLFMRISLMYDKIYERRLREEREEKETEDENGEDAE